jgi:hypothetical protein
MKMSAKKSRFRYDLRTFCIRDISSFWQQLQNIIGTRNTIVHAPPFSAEINIV